MKPSAAQPVNQQRVRASMDVLSVFNLLTDDRFFDKLLDELPEHRERVYPPIQTLAMFVMQALSDDASCRKVVDEHIAYCARHGLRAPSSSTAAYCEARQRLPLRVVSELHYGVARVAMDTMAPAAPIAADMTTLLVDGTGFSMPDTQANQQCFAREANQAEGCGFPGGRLVSFVCEKTGVIVDSHVSEKHGKGGGENTGFRVLLERCEPETLLVGDAIYENFYNWVFLEKVHCHGIFEINGARALPRKIPKRVTLKKPRRCPDWMHEEAYAELPNTLEVRLVVCKRHNRRDKILVTSLLDKKRHSDDAIRCTFRKRWDIEVDYRSFKDTLGAGILSCRTPPMILKELAIHILAYNLIRLLICEAALAARIEPRRISFRHTQQCWCSWVLQSVHLDDKNWQLLLERIAQHRVRNRPGRSEPRAVKRRPKRTTWLDLPRKYARMAAHAYERGGLQSAV